MPTHEDLCANVLRAAALLVQDFHNYGEVLQSDDDDEYSSESTIGSLQIALEALGFVFTESVTEKGKD